MALPALAALSLAGSGMQAYAQIRAAKSQSDNLKRQAELESLTADEIEFRSELDTLFAKRDIQRVMGDTISQMAGSGVDVTIGAPLSTIGQVVQSMTEQIMINQREAEFDARMSEEKAESLRKSARDAKVDGRNRAIATMLSSAGSFAGKMK